jgi:hypothetical protein
VKVEIIDVPSIPIRFKESEEEHRERLRITAERSRIRRQNETPQQREKRLYDLKMRARKTREEVKTNESEEERKLQNEHFDVMQLKGEKLTISFVIQMMDIESLHKFDTKYSVDSVEWCQVEESRDIFAVGTYQLEEKDENISANYVRKGRIYLFRYDGDNDELVKKQQIETDAILDQKWDGKPLATATRKEEFHWNFNIVFSGEFPYFSINFSQ